ncbi:MAG: hypothetical protein LKH96_11620, partial [Lacticaseibacillus paracasei]|nr:hypothetical protein [Lacticaseibacillus paracasei]
SWIEQRSSKPFVPGSNPGWYIKLTTAMKHCCDNGLSVTKQENNASGFFYSYELLVRNVDMSHDNEGVY